MKGVSPTLPLEEGYICVAECERTKLHTKQNMAGIAPETERTHDTNHRFGVCLDCNYKYDTEADPRQVGGVQ